MDIKEQLMSIEKKIEEIRRGIKSTTKEEMVEQIRSKIEETFEKVAIVGDEQKSSAIKITSETIVEFLSKYEELDNLYSYYNEKKSSDYDMDLSQDEEFIRKATKEYNGKLSKLASEVLIQTMNPNDITIDLLEKIKNDKQNETSMTLFGQGLSQYLAHIKPEDVNENLLRYLYDNNFHGEIKNPLINLAYKTFCEGKAKDQQIQGLEQKVERQSKIIQQYEKYVDMLREKVKSAHKIIKGVKDALPKIEARIGKSSQEVHDLGESIKTEEASRSIFSILGQRIKGIFSKTKMLPPAVGECERISNESSTISDAVTKVKHFMQGYDEEKSDAEINQYEQVRGKMNENVGIHESIKNNPRVVDFYFQEEQGWEIDK